MERCRPWRPVATVLLLLLAATQCVEDPPLAREQQQLLATSSLLRSMWPWASACPISMAGCVSSAQCPPEKLVDFGAELYSSAMGQHGKEKAQGLEKALGCFLSTIDIGMRAKPVPSEALALGWSNAAAVLRAIDPKRAAKRGKQQRGRSARQNHLHRQDLAASALTQVGSTH